MSIESKEGKLSKVVSAILVGAVIASCREVISSQTPPEPTHPVLPFEAPQIDVSEIPIFIPEIEIVKKFERAGIIEENDLVIYKNNLRAGFCSIMDCRGFRFEEEVAFKWDMEKMVRDGEEEGVPPIALYRTEITNELARQVPDRVLGLDRIITLMPPDNSPPLQVSRIKGFALYGTFEEEKGEMLARFNETVVLWTSNEFARWNGLTTVVMAKDREQFELTQETFFRLGISFFDIWPYYRESKVVEFALFVGKKMGGMTDEKRLSLGFGLLHALDQADKKTINILLPSLEA